ncbi:MAG: hypothetical protein L6435_11795 [Anaerolineae bacterium]|nr:hypothetical protein [Anaerolineae bacterium]
MDEREGHGARPGEMVKVTCPFCRGRGIYPFGHPSSRAKCGVCGGRKWVLIRTPYMTCTACGGNGRIPGKWMSCANCLGKGVVPVPVKK